MSAQQTALIVGGGIYGLTTAWALARRGWKVTVLEAEALPNPRSSSHDEHRIIRHAYGKLEGYARLMPAAFEQWDVLWADLGTRHVAPIGATYFVRHDDNWFEPTIRALDEMSVGYSITPIDEAAPRYPMIEFDGVQAVVETQGAGMLFPARILNDLVVHLSRIGVELVTGAHVDAIDPEKATARVGQTVYEADRLIVCTGAWIDRLVPEMKGVAVPSRQAVLYLAPPAELADAWSRAPVIVTRGKDGGLYTMPPRYGMRFKVGDHRFSREGDPDGNRVPTARDIEQIRTLFAEGFHDPASYRPLEAKACYYTVTEDEAFIVRPLGAKGHFVSACSGHGFKLAPLVAERLAAGLCGEIGDAELTAYCAARPLELEGAAA
ncbi:NAD(P)/FAD-dependent oxidoreductase [Altererythrobacter fulvus]|uniref:NAD(P)/FAD-dependent oxidoreductase n=1 Tax=Caenibius fulvus TaxID=2126012 RepID=UPI00301892FD